MSIEDEFDVPVSHAPDRLEALNQLLEEAIALEQATSQMEEDLKAAKSALHALRTGRIPDLMAELQMDQLTFQGWEVKVDDLVSGSLPKDPAKRDRAIKWLEEHEGAGLIKTGVSVDFGREQHETALGVWKALDAEGYPANIQSTVHAQTLQSFARQRLKDGDDLDPDVLGLFIGKIAKMKERKA